SCGHDLLDTLASGDVLPQYDRLEPIRLMRQHHAAGVAKIEMKHFVVFQAMQGRPGVGGDQVENRRPMRVGPRIDAWHLPGLAEESALPCEWAEAMQIDHLVRGQCAR